MELNQEINLARIVSRVAVMLDKKYRKGDKEHSGDLMDMSALELIQNSIDETLDNLCYLMTVEQKLSTVKPLTKKP